MRSLHLRIFLAFWLIIVLTIVMVASIGIFYAERARTSLQNFEVSEAMIEASEALRDRGRTGLVTWLESLPFATESVIYIVDEQGRLELTGDGEEVLEDAMNLVRSPDAHGLPGYIGTR